MEPVSQASVPRDKTRHLKSYIQLVPITVLHCTNLTPKRLVSVFLVLGDYERTKKIGKFQAINKNFIPENLF